ncbi:MAG TPA: hypothetical protein VK066_19750 [Chloroflexota bacterium]|nr:hypothetical protein [Chloroflexota bacterium]
MQNAKSFDGDLKMFRDSERPVNFACLRFLRWLAEQGRLEHAVAGPSSGPFAEEPLATAA